MPVVVDGVEMDGRFVKEPREGAGSNAGKAEERESESCPALSEICVKKESDGEASEGEGRPGKEWKEPGPRLVEDVNAIDVRLDGPGKKAGAMRGPQRGREHGD